MRDTNYNVEASMSHLLNQFECTKYYRIGSVPSICKFTRAHRRVASQDT